MYWMDTLATDNYAAMITQFEFRANPGFSNLSNSASRTTTAGLYGITTPMNPLSPHKCFRSSPSMSSSGRPKRLVSGSQPAVRRSPRGL